MNTISNIWQGSAGGKLLIGCVTLIILACLCAVPFTLFGMLAPAEVVAPTSPAFTPAPTPPPPATSPPTATLAPMPTVAPTATRGLPPEAEDYLNTVVRQGTNIADALKELDRLLPQLRLDDIQWQADLGIQVIVIQTSHQKLEALTPPPGLEEAHRVLLEGTGACSEAMDYIDEALDEIDAGAMDQARTLLDTCAVKVEEASELTLEYMEGYK